MAVNSKWILPMPKLSQKLELKQQLSPQQVLQASLLQLNLPLLEQRILHELEINPALEMTELPIEEEEEDEKENNYLCAIVLENRKCGIAVLDHSTGEFHTCTRDQSELLTIIQQFQVNEVIIPENQEKDLRMLQQGDNIFTTKIPDWCCNYDTACESLTNFFKVSTRRIKLSSI